MDNCSSLKRFDAIESLKEQWTELEGFVKPHYSMSWGWISHWYRILPPEVSTYVFSYLKNDKLIALAIITIGKTTRLKGVFPVTRMYINEYPIDNLNVSIAYNGLLAKEDDLEEAWRQFFLCIQKSSVKYCELSISALEKYQYSALLNSQPQLTIEIDKCFNSWSLALNTTEDIISLFKSRSKQKLRQSIRVAGGIEQISVEVAENTESALLYFEELEQLHTKKWNSIGKKGAFANLNWKFLHRSIIASSDIEQEIYLSKVSIANKVIGYIYGHISNGALYLQQTGFEHSDDNKLRLGYICHFMAIQDAKNKGFSHYDFLPDERNSYKKFFVVPGKPVVWLNLQNRTFLLTVESLLRKITKKPASVMSVKELMAL